MNKKRRMVVMIIAVMTMLASVLGGCKSESDVVEAIRFMSFERVDEQGASWTIRLTYFAEDLEEVKKNVVDSIGVTYDYHSAELAEGELEVLVGDFTELEDDGITVEHDAELQEITIETEAIAGDNIDIENLASFLGIELDDGAVSVDDAKTDLLAQGYETDGEETIGE